ncbi:MAG: M23 family metallopeptidase [Paracoccaceae bacterium]
MSYLIIVLLAVSVLLPLFYTVRVLRLAERSKIGWLIAAADATVFVPLVFLVGRWDIAGYYTRFVLLGLFAAALLWSLRAHLPRPWWPSTGLLRTHRSTTATLVLFSAALLYVLSGVRPPVKPRSLSFPLEGGRFVAAQAGGVKLLNYHADHPAQRFAADITAIYPNGFRARGLIPEDLKSYAVFGAAVVSPCAGNVVATRDALPDLIPPDRDRENASGNHVILDCGDLRVELAHLRQGSVTVAAGDRVAVGDPLGRVGNSGNTTEPHLHIHAVDPATGLGVPMAFNGRFPVRNSLFRR